MKTILTATNLDMQPRVRHGFTTRALDADFDCIAVATGVPADKICYLEQVHSPKVVCIDKSYDLTRHPEGDALVTDSPGLLIGVRTADCLPILVYDRKRHVVAAMHAGWRGLAESIVQKTMDILIRQYGCSLQTMEFAFGPCICEEHFEVGDEVIEAYREEYGVRFAWHRKPGGKAHLDLSGTARMSLEDIGFYHRNIADVGLCTFEREDLFHSYRRAPGQGRQFSFIGLI